MTDQKNVDPALSAIATWRQTEAAYNAADTDEDLHATMMPNCEASIVALTTAPTTLRGLKAFCEFGVEASNLMSEGSDGLYGWTPGIPLGRLDVPSGEEMFFQTLGRAVATLLADPAGPDRPDPLADLIAAYRAECEANNASPDEDFPTPIFERLDREPIPDAITRDGALAALRCAIWEEEKASGVEMNINLMRAALAYFEREVTR